MDADAGNGLASPRECGREWWSRSRARSWVKVEQSRAGMQDETSLSVDGCCSDRRPHWRENESSAEPSTHTATDQAAWCASLTKKTMMMMTTTKTMVEEVSEVAVGTDGGDDGGGFVDTGGVKADAAIEDASEESNASLVQPVLRQSLAG